MPDVKVAGGAVRAKGFIIKISGAGLPNIIKLRSRSGESITVMAMALSSPREILRWLETSQGFLGKDE